MSIFEQQLQKLAMGFCRLKGIDTANTKTLDDLQINFEEWDWEIGVGLYGFFRYATLTDNAKLKESLKHWYDQQIQKGLPRKHVNSTSPMLTLCLLCQEDPNPQWKKIITEWADYLLYDAPKTAGGGLQHTVKERDNDGQLWDDTLFMAVLFLWVAGDFLHKEELKNEALYQFLIHSRFLSDPKTSLWYHGWTFEGNHHYADAFWGRGNAWVVMAVPELLRLSKPADHASPLFRYLTNIWQSLIQKVMTLQQDDGSWTTLLDDKTSAQELSATAGFAYGLALGEKLGMLPSNNGYTHHLKCAIDAVLSNINDDGFLENASDGTAMGHDLQFYRDINNAYTPYAQAMAMLLFCEINKDNHNGNFTK